MSYSEQTLSDVRNRLIEQSLRCPTRGEIQDILTALESTDEQKALRADAARYRRERIEASIDLGMTEGELDHLRDQYHARHEATAIWRTKP